MRGHGQGALRLDRLLAPSPVPLPLYPKVDTTYLEYMRDVAREMRKALANKPLDKARRGLEYRAAAITTCGASIEGYICDHCGDPLEGSGAFYDPMESHGHRRNPCHSRVCPRCARRRSAEMKGWGRRLRADVGKLPHGWSWKFLTFTSKYDPSSEIDLTVEALRGRWQGFRDAWRAVWVWLKAGCCSDDERRALGAVCAVELAGNGNVHLHVLCVSPYLDEDELQAVARSGYRKIGHIKPKHVDPSAIKEVCKYPIGTKGGAAESWLGGGRAVDRSEIEYVDGSGRRRKVWDGTFVPALVHPVLAARWEIALYGKRVMDSYGSFRKTKFAGVREKPRPECLPVECPCGARHPWFKVVEPIRKWIARCQVAGVVALYTPRALARRRVKGRYGGNSTEQGT